VARIVGHFQRIRDGGTGGLLQLKLMSPIKIYFAGKISHSDWRHKIIPNLRNASNDVGVGSSCPEIEHVGHLGRYATHSIEFNIQPNPRNVPVPALYVGPFFVGCDHGCFHGKNSHGTLGALNDTKAHDLDSTSFIMAESVRDIVWSNAARQIQSCHVLLAHFDNDEVCTAYGTIAEIGYASALGRRVILSGACHGDSNLWFVKRFQSREWGDCKCHTPQFALDKIWMQYPQIIALPKAV
jgi:hypothetical protein